MIAPPSNEGVSGVMAVFLVNVFGDEYDSVDGAMSVTVISKVVEVDPPVLVAVTVKVVFTKAAPGVPDISPVAVLMDNPSGSDGDIPKETTFPPDTAGTSLEIVCPIVKTFGVA